MLKANLLILVLMLSTLSMGQGVEKECLENIRTGNFYVDLPEYDYYRIERTKKKQIEYFAFGGTDVKMILKIDWIDDLTYQLTPIKWIGFPDDFPKNAVQLTVNISACKSDYFITKTEYNGNVYEIKYYFDEVK